MYVCIYVMNFHERVSKIRIHVTDYAMQPVFNQTNSAYQKNNDKYREYMIPHAALPLFHQTRYVCAALPHTHSHDRRRRRRRADANTASQTRSKDNAAERRTRALCRIVPRTVRPSSSLSCPRDTRFAAPWPCWLVSHLWMLERGASSSSCTSAGQKETRLWPFFFSHCSGFFSVSLDTNRCREFSHKKIVSSRFVPFRRLIGQHSEHAEFHIVNTHKHTHRYIPTCLSIGSGACAPDTIPYPHAQTHTNTSGTT